MIHSFLLIGQSNMSGRGIASEVEPILDKRLKMLRNGRWLPMRTPVSTDRIFAGVSLAESFALAYANDHPGVEVGLIPCSDGGTTLDQWQMHGILFDNAIYQCRLAARTSHIVGILWHQGESDSREGLYQHYTEKFLTIMRAFRKELNLPDVPWILGGLGDYLVNLTLEQYIWMAEHFQKVNEQLMQIAQNDPLIGFASAKGLEANDDNLHFNSKSLREFGLRYYEEFRKLEDKNKVYDEKPKESAAIRSQLELL